MGRVLTMTKSENKFNRIRQHKILFDWCSWQETTPLGIPQGWKEVPGKEGQITVRQSDCSVSGEHRHKRDTNHSKPADELCHCEKSWVLDIFPSVTDGFSAHCQTRRQQDNFKTLIDKFWMSSNSSTIVTVFQKSPRVMAIHSPLLLMPNSHVIRSAKVQVIKDRIWPTITTPL